MSVAKKVHDYLIASGLTEAGAAGLMGNIRAESGMIANRVEILCLQRLREIGKYYTDATYTAFVDDGTISRASFLNPLPGKQYGYGLCQWTSPGRKAGLYDLCKSRKVSIGDVEAQLDWLLTELKTDYKRTYQTLITTSDIATASTTVLTQFECPADTGYAVREMRYQYSKEYYDEFAPKEAPKVTGVTADTIVDIMKSWIGWSEYNGKYRDIIDIYNSHTPKARGYTLTYYDAWCDATVSAAFIKANAVDLIGGTECGVEEHIKTFKSIGIWYENGTIKPRKGDIICYNWDSQTQPNDGYADHIGIVEKVNSDNFITVIEGNYDCTVKRRTIPVGWGYIRGFARPKYATEKAKADKSTTTSEKAAEKPSTKSGTLNKTQKWVGKVTADYLNVRTWAGTEYPNIKSYPVLAYGNYVDVCDSAKANDGVKWYYVRIAGLYYGFVSSEYIEKV